MKQTKGFKRDHNC